MTRFELLSIYLLSFGLFAVKQIPPYLFLIFPWYFTYVSLRRRYSSNRVKFQYDSYIVNFLEKEFSLNDLGNYIKT